MSSRTRNALKFMVAFAWKHDKAYLILLTLEQVFYFLAGIVATIFPGFILEALFEKMDFQNFFGVFLQFHIGVDTYSKTGIT